MTVTLTANGAAATSPHSDRRINWPLGAAVAVLLLIGIVFVVISWNRFVERRYQQAFTL